MTDWYSYTSYYVLAMYCKGYERGQKDMNEDRKLSIRHR